MRRRATIIATIGVLALVAMVGLVDSQQDLSAIFRRTRAFRSGVVDCPLQYDSETREFVCAEGGVLITSFNARSFNVATTGVAAPTRVCTSTPCYLTYTDSEDLYAKTTFVMPSVPLTPTTVLLTWKPAAADVGVVMWGIVSCVTEPGSSSCSGSTLLAARASAAAGLGKHVAVEMSFDADWPPGATITLGITRLRSDPGDTMTGDAQAINLRLEMRRR